MFVSLLLLSLLFLSSCSVVYSQSLPPGSYRQSCSGCTVNIWTNILHCVCKTKSGEITKASELDLNNCINPVDIENQSGSLHCVGGHSQTTPTPIATKVITTTTPTTTTSASNEGQGTASEYRVYFYSDSGCTIHSKIQYSALILFSQSGSSTACVYSGISHEYAWRFSCTTKGNAIVEFADNRCQPLIGQSPPLEYSQGECVELTPKSANTKFYGLIDCGSGIHKSQAVRQSDYAALATFLVVAFTLSFTVFGN